MKDKYLNGVGILQLPKYQVIELYIKDLIDSGELNQGDKIPSENQLCEIHNTSRMTVRQALNNLVIEGYLFKHKGRGTFVSKSKIEKNIQGVRGFTEEMESEGRKVKSVVKKFEIKEPSKEIKEKLFLNNGEQIIHVERIRYGDDTPVLFEELYLPYNIFEDLTKEEMEKSFYSYIENNTNYKISYCIQAIEAQTTSKEISKILETPKDMPVLTITRNTFLNNGRPFEYVVSTYRSDQYRFVQHAVR